MSAAAARCCGFAFGSSDAASAPAHRQSVTRFRDRPLGHAERERTPGAALADHDRDARHAQRGHQLEAAGDRLGLPALLGVDPRVRARGVDEAQHRQPELIRHPQQPLRLAVALRARHPEVTVQVLLGVAPLLLAEHHHALALEARQPGHDRRIVAERTVTPQLDEVRQQLADAKVAHQSEVSTIQQKLDAADSTESISASSLKPNDLKPVVPFFAASHPSYFDGIVICHAV